MMNFGVNPNCMGCGNNFSSFFLQGISIGTTVTILIDSAVFVTGQFEGIQNGIALFSVTGVTGLVRVPVNQIIAIAV